MNPREVDSFSRDAPPPPVEIAFLADCGAPIAALRHAARVARRQGVSADRALLAEQILDETVFYRLLAAELGVAFFGEARDLAHDSHATLDAGYARLLAPRDGALWLFAPEGPQILRLMSAARPRTTAPPRFAITTRSALRDGVRQAMGSAAARQAAFSAERIDPELCARDSLRARWPLVIASAVTALLLLGLLGPAPGVALLCALILGSGFMASAGLRLLACAASFSQQRREARETALPDLDDCSLPEFTVIVALYREAKVARQLVRAIESFDYPRAKLDVKFVVETDDAATAAALRACVPRMPFEIVVAPPGAPRTKPRALNVAAPLGRGDLIAVFDAEDVPHPQQLRRAASLFARLPHSVACLQASLVIDNDGENWKTALFALDYAALFDVYNKGLSALRLPLFLGGSSNHFRRAALCEIGYWDAFNVTEDADLGLRLARAGYEARAFASETYEEAPTIFAALVRQRTRWLKGWMQTALAHLRFPGRFVAELGPRRAIAIGTMFMGGVIGPLLGPFFFLRLAWAASSGQLFAGATGFERALGAAWCVLALAGAAAIFWPIALGMRRRSLDRRRRFIVLLPLWLTMLTIAAWRAAYELWRDPFHWDKTEHGQSARVRRKATV